MTDKRCVSLRVDWNDLWNINVWASCNFKQEKRKTNLKYDDLAAKLAVSKHCWKQVNSGFNWCFVLERHIHTDKHGGRPGSRPSSSTLSSGSLFTLLYFPPSCSLFDSDTLSLPPPPLLSPSPLKGTLLGPTVCVTSWAGQSQWGVWLCVPVCLLLCIYVFKEPPHEYVH